MFDFLDFCLRARGGKSVACPASPGAAGARRGMASLASTLTLMLAALLGLGLSGLLSRAQAQPATLSCGAHNFYALAADGALRHVAVSGNSGTVTTVLTPPFSGLDYNGLGINVGGTKAYAFARSGAPNLNIAQVRSYTPGAADWVNAGAPYNTGLNGALIAGGFDYVNDKFYFGGYEAGDFRLFKFDPAGNSFVNVGTLKIPAGNTGTNGDLAFDGKGNMFFVQSSDSRAYIYSVTTTQLAGGGDITPLEVASFATTAGEAINGIAYDTDGMLYLGYQNRAFRYDPATDTLTEIVPSGNGISNGSDLASCAAPATFALLKNISARADASDQFTLTATIASRPAISATTAGAATGVQSQQVGPVPVVPGTRVTFSEAMAAGSGSALSVYTSTWACTNNGAPMAGASGNGTSGTVDIPVPAQGDPAPEVECTFTNAPPAPQITLTKSVTPTTVSALPQQLAYSFLVQNTGADTIHGLNITESVFTGSGGPLTISCPVTTLAAGAQTTCTATYDVTATDMGAGVIDNTATAHGLTPSNTPVDSNPSSAKVTTQENPQLTLTKSASPTTYSQVGNVIHYSLLVRNSGNVVVNALSVVDTAFSGHGAAPLISCPVSSLAVGASTTCTASYSVVQDDLSAGRIDNTAQAHGTHGPGNDPVLSNLSSARVTATAAGVTPVPTLDRWGLWLLALLLAGVGALLLRRRHG